MPCCSAAGLDSRIIPAGFNAPLEFLTGFTVSSKNRWGNAIYHWGETISAGANWWEFLRD
jgi:hypothetical protein